MICCQWMRPTAVAAGVVLVSMMVGRTAFAQTDTPSFEVGGQIGVLRLSDSPNTNVGVGGRVAINLTRWLGVESEYQFVPTDEFNETFISPDGREAGIRYERRRSTALFGVKAGHRGERIGLFARARPGFTTLTDRGVDCQGDVCALMLLTVPEYRREFALDLGGVVEFYPSSRWLARADIGALRIRHRSSAPPCASGDCSSWNLAASAGLGIRF